MTSRSCYFVVALSVAFCFCAPFSGPAWGGEPLTFEQHIRPILKAHCFHCHGEEEKHEGNLDLRLVRLMVQGGDGGPAIVPGKSAESYLIERVVAGEMPPEGKGLAERELATLRAWVDQGAAIAQPEPETLSDIAETEREFWSFQPIGPPPLPTVNDSAQLRSPIDAFLLAELQKRNLSFSPEADDRTLIRRLQFDLVGLPPSPDEVDAILADESPDAYERLVDRLLAQPQYGERWGRHWLDVAGYADSNGYNEADSERKYAFKYRDYVIRALNADRPWDEFIIQQLAGDELLTPPYSNLAPEQADLLAATGFLRMAPDGTGEGGADPLLARNDVVAETIKIVSSSLLGLTVGCAQCHNHRYDPISQVDYYRVRAIFEPAFDTKNWRPPQARLVSLWSDATRAEAAAIDAELKALADERLAELDKIVMEIFDAEVAKLPEELRELARAARAAEKDRTPELQQILKDYPSLKVDRGSAYLYEPKRINEFNKRFDHRQQAIKARRPAEDFVPCLTEVPGQIPPTHLLYRGDVNQPKQPLEPAELSVLGAVTAIPADDPSLPTSGRRLAYARWVTSGKHPLVGRVVVNRFWLHHFGRGIVATPGDFGRLGEPPSHPQLLDWLAAEFSASGWELKRFHRLLLQSTAYRQVSTRNQRLDALDPENRLLGRMSIRRLEAEALRDSILAASGLLNSELFGEPVPVTVDEVGQVIVGLDNRDSAGRPEGGRESLGANEFRRSVYIQVRRSQPLTMLATFDAATLTPNCELRNRSTVAPQSLLLMNSEFVLQQSRALAQRAIERAGDDPAARVRMAWGLALSQEPSVSQIDAALAFLATYQRESASQPPPIGKTPAPEPPADGLSALCQALFSSNGFLYVD
ncbi:MAG TPA: PSD1 and planctomycete cytochrome C domain-containing protein [Pirellulaceae bacterium]|nr:PSD1 and planctomycete cytochrome C domain-containing protein [Pirellulaceae bacterium]